MLGRGSGQGNHQISSKRSITGRFTLTSLLRHAIRASQGHGAAVEQNGVRSLLDRHICVHRSERGYRYGLTHTTYFAVTRLQRIVNNGNT